ncbi:MAG: STAS domain-containing protein [Pyrinomonadaceae bacterium]|nr:STAS domain-containing protein [Pyrinomonadaceae bacterium]MBP6214497.1 STAS domain-containing protein [Pyrinomonadaceae bacterium]
MPTNITQIDDELGGITILRVKGEMLLSDAVFIERLASQIRDDQGNAVSLDLADLDFMDSDAARVLKRLDAERGFDLIGMEIFLQNAVNQAEKDS